MLCLCQNVIITILIIIIIIKQVIILISLNFFLNDFIEFISQKNKKLINLTILMQSFKNK